MAENTKIEWTDHTFNPWEGCTKVSPGCEHCYAETRNARYGGGVATNWGANAPRRRTSASNWAKPLRWNREADAFYAKHGRRQRVFCASLADVFDNVVDPQWRADLFALIVATPNLDWLLLTKRIGMAERLAAEAFPAAISNWPRNVWLGATIVNQEEADRDIPKLLDTPAAVRFLSMEPLLGPVDLTKVETWQYRGAEMVNALTGATFGMFGDRGPTNVGKIDWVIAGGESGADARPIDRTWVRNLRDQCAAAGTAFLFKQWGEWFPYGEVDAEGHDNSITRGEREGLWREWPIGFSVRIGKKLAGRHLYGRTHDGFPGGEA